METTDTNTNKRVLPKITSGSVVSGIMLFAGIALLLSMGGFLVTEDYGRWLIPSSGLEGVYLSQVAARVILISGMLLGLVFGTAIGFVVSHNFWDKPEKE